MRALVTGAAGFVGRYMMVELALNGYDVTGVDLLDSVGKPELVGTLRWFETDQGPGSSSINVEYRKCNMMDEDSVFSILRDVRPDVVVHLAAQSSAGRSFNDPLGTVRVNVIGSLNLFEAARRLNGSAGSGDLTILSVGSSDEYGIRSEEEMPLMESVSPDPISPYAVSKAAQTMLARQYARTYGLRIIATRSFNHTGPLQSERFVLPSFAKQCALVKAGMSEPLIKVGNIGVVRDFLDVRDTVRAYRLLLEAGKAGEVYNVCSGSGVKLADALDRLIELAGVSVTVNVDESLLRPGDINVLVGSNEKLMVDTSWEKRYSVDDMLQALFDYWLGEVENL